MVSYPVHLIYMNLESQAEYWDRVADTKTFTHPVDHDLLSKIATRSSAIIDHGCGYGRVVQELNDAGYTNVKGFDTSAKLIMRGRANGVMNIWHMDDPGDMPVPDGSADLILLFAVLTCIPANHDQDKLVALLLRKLKPGGMIYISDYYLQEETTEVSRYTYFDDDKDNYGVFHLPEGATFRHHTREWIMALFSKFNIVEEHAIDVTTMNGHKAKAFQMVVRK